MVSDMFNTTPLFLWSLGLLVLVLVIAVLREFLCWVFKINERNRLLEKQCNQNVLIIKKLQEMDERVNGLEKLPD